MSLPIGTVLDGKYKIVEVLGEGGMGTVYKVEQAGTPPFYYAVKELVINPNTSEDERKTAIERFNKEIVLLRDLKHPHIASFKVYFQERGNYYFVMEFVPGRSLEKILEDSKGPLDEEQVIPWMMQVCEALSYIHSRTPPIILRDLKPGNIMITPNNEVQLIDFGIARTFDPNKRTNTENLGTIAYASPEHLGSITPPGQRRSPQNPGRLVQTDARSDIYSLGATMYHLLTNHEPEPIQTPASGSIYARNPRLRTEQRGNRVDCPVEQVIIKAMRQDPAQRFQNAEAMRVALQHCLANNAAPATLRIPAISPNATIVVPTNPLICPKCHFSNRPVAKFCKNCGQPLTAGATPVPPRVAAQTTVRAPIQARPVQPAVPSYPVAAINRAPVGTTPAGNPTGAYQLGLQYLNNKNYVGAINQFRLAERLGAVGKLLYDVQYNLGRTYRQYGQSIKDKDKHLFAENLKFAIEEFERAAKTKSDSLDIYFQLGMCYHDLALYPQSVVAFKNALKLAPRDPAIYYQLGKVSMDQGYNREAEAYFLEGLKINPDHALILVALGRLYLQMNQARSAISVLRQATQREPALWEGWYELGRAHMKEKEWKLALSALEQARQQSPETAEIYSAMASCYLRMKNKAEARQMLRECLQRNPNSIEATRLQKQL